MKKTLYGLKQALRAWYSQIDKYFMCHRFKKSKSELTLYIKKIGIDILIAFLYTDDLIYTSNNETIMKEFIKDMTKTYE